MCVDVNTQIIQIKMQGFRRMIQDYCDSCCFVSCAKHQWPKEAAMGHGDHHCTHLGLTDALAVYPRPPLTIHIHSQQLPVKQGQAAAQQESLPSPLGHKNV